MQVLAHFTNLIKLNVFLGKKLTTLVSLRHIKLGNIILGEVKLLNYYFKGTEDMQPSSEKFGNEAQDKLC